MNKKIKKKKITLRKKREQKILSDHPAVINGKITLKPNYFPIDIKVIKGHRLTQTESDLVAVQDPIDTSEIDIGTL